MVEPWFVAPPESWGEGVIALPPGESRHAAAVLRLSPGALVTVTDGRGRLARCSLAEVNEASALAAVVEDSHAERTGPEIVVYQAAAKGRKVDDMIERVAEVGVADVRIFNSERSVVRWDAAKSARLDERYAAIARSVAKQSRSPFVMRTSAGLHWKELLASVDSEPLALALWERATEPLRDRLPQSASRLALVIGPEGGFSDHEAGELTERGASPVTLGERILRTENAALVAASAVLFHFGAIG